MALSDSSLKTKIVAELQAQGFDTGNEFAKTQQMAEAIAKAVVDEITSNAEVVVAGGSSAGSYQVS